MQMLTCELAIPILFVRSRNLRFRTLTELMAELELEPDTGTLGSRLFPSQHAILTCKWRKVKQLF